MESELYYHVMNGIHIYFPSIHTPNYYIKDEKVMSQFDIEMSYRLSSDIPTLYISSRANYSTPPLPKVFLVLL